MSILSVDNISPIGSGTSVTVNSAATLVLTNANSTGVITATTFSGSGASLTNLPAANLTGTLPAISGANLTSLPAQATIANNADNRVITGGSGVNLNGEASLTYTTGNLEINSTSCQLDLMEDGATDSNHRIRQNAGNLYIQKLSDNKSSSTTGVVVDGGGHVELYYSGTKRIETTNTGAVVTGICTATTFEATTFSKTPTNTPAFHAYRNGSFSPTFPNSTWTKITFLTTETLDTDNAYDNSSSGTTANRFTVPSGKGGYYQVAAALNFYADSNDLKSALVAIYKNGGKTMSAYGFISNYTSGVRHFQCDIAGMLNLNAGDYLEVYAYFTTNGGANNYISNDANGLRGNYFSAFKLII